MVYCNKLLSNSLVILVGQSLAHKQLWYDGLKVGPCIVARTPCTSTGYCIYYDERYHNKWWVSCNVM